MEFSKMKGVSEEHRREVGVNLTGGRVNAVEICEKILGAPSLDRLLDQFRLDQGLGEVHTDERYVKTFEPERRHIKDEEVRDDTIMED